MRRPRAGSMDRPRPAEYVVRSARTHMRRPLRHEAFPSQFQVLVADNDPPPLEHVFNIVEFSYERPFVPWMRHPGPKHVVSLE
jgi:hypothetical protein